MDFEKCVESIKKDIVELNKRCWEAILVRMRIAKKIIDYQNEHPRYTSKDSKSLKDFAREIKLSVQCIYDMILVYNVSEGNPTQGKTWGELKREARGQRIKVTYSQYSTQFKEIDDVIVKKIETKRMNESLTKSQATRKALISWVS